MENFPAIDGLTNTPQKRETRRALPFATGFPLVAYLRNDRGD